MRKIVPLFRATLLIPLLLALLLPATALAHDFEASGIYYNIVNGEAVVTFQGTSYSQYDEYSGSVVIPSSVSYNGVNYPVTAIGEYAFRYCSGLTSVNIPNSVTTIGRSAFNQCTGLTDIQMPNSVNNISYYAFDNTAWYNNQPEGPVYIGLVFYKYKGTMPEGTTFTIADGTLGIAGDAFYNCTGLTTINIPSSVITIGAWAFEECRGLTTINNPNSIVTIGDYAFYGCSSLTSINFMNSVTTIGDYAFYECTGLTSMTIPRSVTSIGNYPFCFCTALTNIQVADGNPKFDSRNNCNAIIETATNKLIAGCQSTVIPNSVTTISDYAFLACQEMTSIDIPSSVTAIGFRAFSNCSGLTNLTIPNSVSSIGERAFSACTGLTSIIVDNDNPMYDSRDNCNAIIETATNILIAGCNYTIIPNSVTAIGNYAFYNCTGLTSINIPDRVTAIGDHAFYMCNGLTSINIPNNTRSIGNNAFYCCSGLTSVTIPNSVSAIGDYAFANCNGLKDVWCFIYEPKYNLSMGNGAFTGGDYSNRTLHVLAYYISDYQQDSNWSRYFGNIVEIPSKIEVDGIYYKVTSANEVAVTYDYNHKYTGDVNIPETITFAGMTYSVTAIGDDAFESCFNLTSVTIPNSVTSIDGCAFRGCTKLANIHIPNSVTTIGGSAFQNCIRLATVNIPNSVTTIGVYAFEFCYRLTEITVPESVTSIGLTTFSYCYSLAQVTWNARNCTLEYDFFDEEDHLPFAYCPSLKKITIGSEVESIDDEIFCIYDPVYNNIDTVVCLADVPPVISEYCFFNHTYQNATLSVPKASEASYATATGWKEFVNRTTIEPHENILVGDVDGDGKVSIGDVSDLIDYLLSGDSHDINAVNADVDGDRIIGIGDVADLIDKILGRN